MGKANMEFFENPNVYIIHCNEAKYPSKDTLFRPQLHYPEMPFDELSDCNTVYGMFRDCMHLMGLDSEQYNTKYWNPLGEYIKPGDVVLVKPNMVMHKNQNTAEGEECLYTHPSLVAAVLDYSIIALQGEGKIIVGDAPLQECKFGELVKTSGYEDLINYYINKGVNIELCDFRGTKTFDRGDGIHISQNEESLERGTIIQLGEKSAFFGLSSERIENFRVGNYDPRIMNKHHDARKHEYMISEKVLSADVVINMPKPKTHKYAGITGALKNLVGINTYKELVPHYTHGTKLNDEDTFKNENEHLKQTKEFYDSRCISNADGDIDSAEKYAQLYRKTYEIGRIESGERYWGGAWYGNDTLWRSIVDLNRALLYGDGSSNELSTNTKRKYLVVADMIVCGQKEGPLSPSPKDMGMLMMGENPVCIDRAISSIMGFDYSYMPLLANMQLETSPYKLYARQVPIIHSNDSCYDKQSLRTIMDRNKGLFVPSAGWEFVFGNKYKDALYELVKDSAENFYIYGAGQNGLDIYFYLLEKDENIAIAGFFDNDKEKVGKTVAGKVKIEKPRNVEGEYACLLSVGHKYQDEIIDIVNKCNFNKVIYLTDYGYY